MSGARSRLPTRLESALRCYLGDRGTDRPAWPYPGFLRGSEPQRDVEMEFEVPADLWGEFSEEADKQEVTVEQLAEHAAFYFAAELDAGRVTERILADLDAGERGTPRRPGELIHIDVKKLGRIGAHGAGHRVLGRSWAKKTATRTDAAGVRRLQTGWDRVHVCVDDATRLAYVEVLADEKTKTVVGFLSRAVGFYRSHGIAVEGLMTDNGPAYRSAAHVLACRAMGIKHIRTRPYRPQTNGKAERFIRTMLREWAYAAVYGSSPERAAALSGWLERYNYRRRHGALPPLN